MTTLLKTIDDSLFQQLLYFQRILIYFIGTSQFLQTLRIVKIASKLPHVNKFYNSIIRSIQCSKNVLYIVLPVMAGFVCVGLIVQNSICSQSYFSFIYYSFFGRLELKCVRYPMYNILVHSFIMFVKMLFCVTIMRSVSTRKMKNIENDMIS